jgi:hypothetical protein
MGSAYSNEDLLACRFLDFVFKDRSFAPTDGFSLQEEVR